MKRALPIVMLCLRILLAAVFIFSGFVKAVDPWGTAIKLTEYFYAFGMGWLSGTAYFCSIVLSTGELLLGLALLFRLKERIVSFMVMIFMAFFTVLTLILAIWDPVSDCGCFGDAIKLTNWQTFYKNLILLPISVIVWRYAVRHPRTLRVRPMLEGSMLVALAFFAAGIGLYSLRYLPLVDFLPFKQGVYIPGEMISAGTGEVKTVLLYKDRTTGKTQEFSLKDTEWYDTVRWEFIDTRFEEIKASEEPSIQEFSIFNQDGNLTPALFANERAYFIITLTDPAKLTDKCRERFIPIVQYAEKYGYPVIGVTSALLPDHSSLQLTEEIEVPLYNMDGVTLKTFIRTHEGLVIIEKGVILGKWSCLNLPEFSDKSSPVISSVVLRDVAQARECRTVGVLFVFILLLYGFWEYWTRRRL